MHNIVAAETLSPSPIADSGADTAPPTATQRRALLGTVLVIAALFNLIGLDRQGYGNVYYAAAIKSMLLSRHNFFFVSFDPSSFVSIDKPPLGYWVQALFVKFLGFGGVGLMLPQALAGALSVAVLHHLVARSFGCYAGLIAALALAVSPISVVANRDNIIDSQLVLVVLLAAWAALKAVETGRFSWLLACAVLLGLGFNIKMLQAYLVLPSLVLLYLVAAPCTPAVRLRRLIAAAAVLLVVSLAWIVVVDAVPANQRPYVGSSCDNSELNLALGYNGLGRLTGSMFQHCASGTGTAAGSLEGLPPGPLRLVDDVLGSQIGWLLPLALIGLVIGAIETKIHLDRRQFRLDLTSRQQSLLLWGVWLISQAAFFSVADYRAYYLVMLAPAIAALSGIGITALWRDYRHGGRWVWLLPGTLLCTAAGQAYLLIPFPHWSRVLSPLIVGICLLIALIQAAPLLGISLSRRLGPVLVAGGVLALLIAPTTWSIYSVANHLGGIVPYAGPIPHAKDFPSLDALLGSDAADLPALTGKIDPTLLAYLETNRGKATYLVAVGTAVSGTPFILAADSPVMALGGLTGSDPILTPHALAKLTATGALRYVLLGTGNFLIGPDLGLGKWVIANCAPLRAAQYETPPSDPTRIGPFGFDKSNLLFDCGGPA